MFLFIKILFFHNRMCSWQCVLVLLIQLLSQILKIFIRNQSMSHFAEKTVTELMWFIGPSRCFDECFSALMACMLALMHRSWASSLQRLADNRNQFSTSSSRVLMQKFIRSGSQGLELIFVFRKCSLAALVAAAEREVWKKSDFIKFGNFWYLWWI